MACLEDALERLPSVGSLVVLTGEAGVGKSRLAHEVTAMAARRSLPSLTGRASEAGATPLRPLVEAFLAAFRDHPPPSDPGLDPFRLALSPLVPEWRTATDAPTEPLVRNEGILRLLRLLGRSRGTLLVLEDLHWADAETLTFVDHLGHHVHSQPVLCLCTIRTEQSGPGLALVRSLAGAGKAAVMELDRLSRDAVAELARVVGGDALSPADVEIVCERAEGLPLFAEDLLATARATGTRLAQVVPLTFAGTVTERLAMLGHRAQRMLWAASLLGRRFDWTLVGPLTGSDEAEVATALRAGVEAGLLSYGDDGGLAFRHALTRDAILAQLLPSERSALARRALMVVERAYPGLPAGWLALAAGLAEDAGEGRRAISLLLDAARRALAEGALSSAESILERARRLSAACGSDPAPVDDLLLEALALAGKTDAALELGRTVLAHRSPAEAAVAHLRLARAATAATRWSEADAHVRAAQVPGAPRKVATEAEAMAATIALAQGHPQAAAQIARRARAAGREEEVPAAVCEALEVLGRLARQHDLAAAQAWFAEAADHAARAGLRVWEIRARHELGTIDMFRTSSLAGLEQARRMASEAGAVSLAAVVDLQLAGARAVRFEAEAALDAVARGMEVITVSDLGLAHPMLLVQAATAHAVRGRRLEMEAAIGEAVALSGEHPDVLVVAVGHARGFFALLQEDRPAARAAFAEALAWSRHARCAVPGAFAGWLALVATVDDPDSDATRAELRASPAMAVPMNAVLLGYADAVAAGRAGHRREAKEMVDAVDATSRRHQRTQGWVHLGHRLVAEAAVADGWGEPARWLREALPWFEDQGHGRVASACRQLLAYAGAPVPRRGRGEATVPAALRSQGVTSRETDVLLLVAQGLTNRQIAERLYLSARTVEKHVERLRDKTSAASRAELAGMAAKYGVGAH